MVMYYLLLIQYHFLKGDPVRYIKTVLTFLLILQSIAFPQHSKYRVFNQYPSFVSGIKNPTFKDDDYTVAHWVFSKEYTEDMSIKYAFADVLYKDFSYGQELSPTTWTNGSSNPYETLNQDGGNLVLAENTTDQGRVVSNYFLSVEAGDVWQVDFDFELKSGQLPSLKIKDGEYGTDVTVAYNVVDGHNSIILEVTQTDSETGIFLSNTDKSKWSASNFKIKKLNGTNNLASYNMSTNFTEELVGEDSYTETKSSLVLSGDEYLVLPDNVAQALDFGTRDFTIECRFKTGDDVTTEQYILEKRSGGYGGGYYLEIKDGFLYGSLITSSRDYKLRKAISPRTDYFVAITYDRDSEMKMYVYSGAKRSTAQDISSFVDEEISQSSRDFSIGVFGANNGSNYGKFFSGTIYEIALSTRVKAKSEIDSYYDSFNHEYKPFKYPEPKSSTKLYAILDEPYMKKVKGIDYIGYNLVGDYGLTEVCTNGDFSVDSNGDGLADDWTTDGYTTTSLSNGVQELRYAADASAWHYRIKHDNIFLDNNIYILEFTMRGRGKARDGIKIIAGASGSRLTFATINPTPEFKTYTYVLTNNANSEHYLTFEASVAWEDSVDFIQIKDVSVKRIENSSSLYPYSWYDIYSKLTPSDINPDATDMTFVDKCLVWNKPVHPYRGSFTVSGLFKVNDYDEYYGVFGGSNGGTYFHILHHQDNNKLRLRIHDDVTGFTYEVLSTKHVADSVYHYFVAGREVDSLFMFLDGDSSKIYYHINVDSVSLHPDEYNIGTIGAHTSSYILDGDVAFIQYDTTWTGNHKDYERSIVNDIPRYLPQTDSVVGDWIFNDAFAKNYNDSGYYDIGQSWADGGEYLSDNLMVNGEDETELPKRPSGYSMTAENGTITTAILNGEPVWKYTSTGSGTHQVYAVTHDQPITEGQYNVTAKVYLPSGSMANKIRITGTWDWSAFYNSFYHEEKDTWVSLDEDFALNPDGGVFIRCDYTGDQEVSFYFKDITIKRINNGVHVQNVEGFSEDSVKKYLNTYDEFYKKGNTLDFVKSVTPYYIQNHVAGDMVNNVDTFTVEFLVKDTADGNHGIAGCYGSGDCWYIMLSGNDTKKLSTRFRVGSIDTTVYTSYFMRKDTYYHMAFVYYSSGFKFYVDGNLEHTHTFSSPLPPINSLNDFVVGGISKYSYGMNGQLYEVRFIKRMLSEEEIRHNYRVISDRYNLTSKFTPRYEEEAYALFKRMDKQPTDERKAQINTLIKDLKVGGVWDKLDLFYMFADNTKFNSTLNWVSKKYKLQESGSPLFVRDEGFITSPGNFLVTGYKPLNSNKVSRESITMGIYGKNMPVENINDIYMDDGSSITAMKLRSSGTECAYRLNGGSWGVETVEMFPASGAFEMKRSDDSTQCLTHNGELIDVSSSTSTEIPDKVLNIGELGTNKQYVSLWVGEYLSDSESRVLSDAIDRYLTSIGKNPIPDFDYTIKNDDATACNYVLDNVYHKDITVDLSGNNNKLALNKGINFSGNSPIYRSGKFGKSFDPDNTNYLLIDGSNADDLNVGTDDFTLEAWITTGTDISSIGYIVTKGVSGAHYRLFTHEGRLKFYINDGTEYWMTSAVVVDPNKKYYVAVTLDRDGHQKVYVNGVLKIDQNKTNTTNIVSSNHFTIGSQYNSSSYFRGEIEQVHITKRVKTAEEIQNYYNSIIYKEKPEEDLVMWFEGSDDVESDGDFVVKWGDSGLHENDAMQTVRDYQPRYIDSTLSFNGVDDYLEIRNSYYMNLDSIYTIEAYVYTPNLSGVKNIYMKEFSDNACPIDFAINYQYVGIRYYSGGAWHGFYNSNQLPGAGWYYVSAVVDMAQGKAWVTYNKDTKEVSIDGAMMNNSGKGYIGTYSPTTYPYYGRIAAIKIWNRARSEEERNNQYFYWKNLYGN